MRGLLWFLSLHLAMLLVCLLALWSSVPFWVITAAWLAVIGLNVIMWFDSFRPGKMTWPLWVIFVAISAAIFFLPPPFRLIAQPFKVPSAAMEPTLLGEKQGTPDQVLVNRICYRFSSPQRGDLIVFRTGGIPSLNLDTFYIKRLVGLPGEKIEIRDGHVFANGRQLNIKDGIPDFEYTEPSGTKQDFSGGYQVSPDGYFVLGDNSARSSDSRFWGSVPKQDVIGRVARIYYPFSRASVPR